MTSAIVLCAGRGTRLRPLSRELAKPLMPVGDRPAIVHIIEALRSASVREIGINTHHRAGDFVPYFDNVSPQFHVVHEPEILGTAGGVAHVAAHLGAGDLVVWNGDVVAPELDVEELIAQRRQRGLSMLWVVEPLGPGEGTVGLDVDDNVVRLRDERFGDEAKGGNYVGVLAMASAERAQLPPRGCMVADVALPLLRGGGQIGALFVSAAWDDIGSPEGLLRANLRWLERQGIDAWCAPDASVAATVRLEQSVISHGARVGGSGVVRECVLLPGGVLVAPAQRALAGQATRTILDPLTTGA
jgi:mannose-1-phosphate guanylyltransferase